VGPADELLEVGGDRVAGEVAPRNREVGGRAAVEAAELLDLDGGQPVGAAPCPGQQLLEPLPLRAAIGYELLDHGWSGR